MNDQDEMFEAATETPAFLGCPAHMPKQLPGGFDGVEPGEKSKSEVEVEELKKRGAKLFACNERSREKIVEIANLANECLLNTNHPNGYEPGQYGRDYMTYGKAIGQIRRICKQSFAEEIVLDYEWLAQIMTSDHFEPECLAKAIEAEASKKLQGNQNANIRKSDESTRKVLEHLREDSPDSPDSRSEAEIQREEARQKRKIHWTCYPTKVDLCVMGKTEQNGKVYEVRVNKRGDAKVQDTYGQCKVNGKTVLTVSFTGGAWMLKRILTQGMQALVNYKAKKNRDSRRNYKRRDAAAKQQAHDNKGDAAKEVK